MGSVSGYVVHQLLVTRSASPDGAPAVELTIGAPFLNTVLATGAGLVGGRRARLSAFAVGFMLSAVAGTKIDAMLPGFGRTAAPSEGA